MRNTHAPPATARRFHLHASLLPQRHHTQSSNPVARQILETPSPLASLPQSSAALQLSLFSSPPCAPLCRAPQKEATKAAVKLRDERREERKKKLEGALPRARSPARPSASCFPPARLLAARPALWLQPTAVAAPVGLSARGLARCILLCCSSRKRGHDCAPSMCDALPPPSALFFRPLQGQGEP